jgi:Fur family peroxide stress response transcriptional regulator
LTSGSYCSIILIRKAFATDNGYQLIICALMQGGNPMADPQARLDEMIVKLRERGHRLTPQRIAVLRILAASEGHPSVEQIYERVKADFPMTSLATIYKTVTLLKEMGEVLELGFSDGSNHYDGNKPYPHPHLICTRCGNIVDPEVATLSELHQDVARSTGYRILSHRLDFLGVCPQCQEKE